MEKIYPDSDDIRLQIGSVISYITLENEISEKEKILKKNKDTTDRLSKLKEQMAGAERAIDLIYEGYQGIEVHKHLENEVLQDIVRECSYVEIHTNGKPRITSSMRDFVLWLLNHGYFNADREAGKDEVTAEFIFNNFESRCRNIESIKKVIREVCGKKQKSRKNKIRKYP